MNRAASDAVSPEPKPEPRSVLCARGTLIVAAAAALGAGAFVHDGTFDPTAIACVAVALCLLFLALSPRLDRLRVISRPSVLAGAVLFTLMLQFASAMTEPPGGNTHFITTTNDARTGEPHYQFHHLSVFWALSGAAAVYCGSMLMARPLLGRFSPLVLVALQVALAVWLIRIDVDPGIDVFIFQNEAGSALVHVHNPYRLTFENIYSPGAATRAYGPGVIGADGRLQYGYPYMPLTLFMALPGLIGHDVRYAMVLAVAATGLLIAYTRNTWLGYASAAGLLFMARTAYVIDMSWTEPLVAFLLALTVFCAVRRPRWTPYALGLLLASKQYTPFAIVLAPLLFGWEPRRLIGPVLRAILTAAVVTLPLVLLDVQAFVHSAIMWQLRQPFRMDALSFLVVWAKLRGTTNAPVAAAFVALVVAGGLSLWRLRPSPANFAAAVAITYFAFFAFNKQAFMNYYFFALAGLWCSVAALDLPAQFPLAEESL
jgi:hypothetical protein